MADLKKNSTSKQGTTTYTWKVVTQSTIIHYPLHWEYVRWHENYAGLKRKT